MFKMKVLRKFFLYTFTSLLVSIFITAVYIYFPYVSDKFDGNIRDYMFILRGEVPDSRQVTIVDIDEESLNSLGQWPWSRNILSQIVQNLTNAGVGVIGFDVVFAEVDNSNPSRVFKKFNQSTDGIPNYDEEFAYTIANSPTILGYQFQLEDEKFIKKKPPRIPAIFIERNRQLGEDYLINAKGTILNTDIIQDNGYSSGFFNNVPDESGIIRSVPLIIRYQDQIYPSLALEMVRASLGINKVYIDYNELGVSAVTLGDFAIQTDRFGRILVNFRGKEKTFKYVSAYDIYTGNFDQKDIEGKAILIGASAAGILDLRAIPFESVYPGVEVHANVIDNILNGDFLTKPAELDSLEILSIFILSFIVTLAVTYTPLWVSPFVFLLFSAMVFYGTYYLLFTHMLVFNIVFPFMAVLVATIITSFLDYIFEIRQEEAIKKKFATKVSPDVMNSLLNNLENESLEAMEKEVTIFFSDVRNFTNISEAFHNPKILIEFLNKYMEPMTDIIIKEQGTIDKYIGDAIMAYWNAPADVENHADKALTATLNQLHYIKELNETLETDPKFEAVVKMSKEKNLPIIDIGIGLNTGMAIVGEMGSSKRSDYTVIGDAINVGARLESLCKFYNSKCNISQQTKDALKEKYISRLLDFVMVKGKSEPIKIWQVHDFNRDDSFPKLYDVSRDQLIKELKYYHSGVQLYQDSKFDKALEIFKDIDTWENKTNQNIYKIYIERCEHYIKNPPENFNGVFIHTTKG